VAAWVESVRLNMRMRDGHRKRLTADTPPVSYYIAE
jgi:hypothetical protein